MNRVKLIPSQKTASKPNRYHFNQENSSNLTTGPSPGKEVNETIESPEPITNRKDEAPSIRNKG